ncbi:hypothetical protein F9802_17265 [Bacillus aerolatus]|uniref:PepSY domain-containing protein n=1 Tax=Bacillus aerolatus TaxID=2653354 RepID=A0A6I1FGJ2_9BACI|nr:PepSY domain-containing protein [Bacillus aerolatus]KAB7704444.1 hypothetical protein F9802_17265 [Bacillus aerolatus]
MKVKVLLIVFIIFGLSFTLFQIFKKEHPVNISQKEAEAIAVKLYGGKVLNTTVNKENNNYQISIDNHKGIYNMYVDGNTKKVSNVRLIKRKESLLTIDEAKKNIEKELNGRIDQIKQVNKKEGAFAEATVKKDDKHYSVEYDLKKKKIVANTEKKMASNTQMKDHLSKGIEQKSNTNTSLISKQQARNIALQQINGKVTNLSEVITQNGKHYKVTVDGPSEGAHVYVQANTGKVSSISWYAKAQPKPQPKPQSDPKPSGDDDVEDDDDEDDLNDDDENSTDNDD